MLFAGLFKRIGKLKLIANYGTEKFSTMVCEATIVLIFSVFEKMDPKRELAASPTFRSISQTTRDYYFKRGKTTEIFRCQASQTGFVGKELTSLRSLSYV